MLPHLWLWTAFLRIYFLPTATSIPNMTLFVLQTAGGTMVVMPEVLSNTTFGNGLMNSWRRL